MTKHDWQELWRDILQAIKPSPGDIRDYAFMFGSVTLLVWVNTPFWAGIPLAVFATYGFSTMCDRIWGKR